MESNESQRSANDSMTALWPTVPPHRRGVGRTVLTVATVGGNILVLVQRVRHSSMND